MPSPLIPALSIPSAASYALLSKALSRSRNPNLASASARSKLVSATHSSLVALLALYALAQSPFASQPPPNRAPPAHGGATLDDSRNPIIRSSSDLANALTAVETGYIVFDTLRLLAPSATESLPQATRRSLTGSPALFAHHVGLSAGLVALQAFIARGEERGVWVIVAFLLMRASGPVMTLRWWLRKTRSQESLALDLAHLVVFCAARFGVVYWILRRYGDYHGLGAAEVLARLRWQCRAGTSLLVALNAIWGAAMLAGISRRLAR